MPFVNVKVIEGVFTPDQKQAMVKRLTDTMVSRSGRGHARGHLGGGRGGPQRRLGIGWRVADHRGREGAGGHRRRVNRAAAPAAAGAAAAPAPAGRRRDYGPCFGGRRREWAMGGTVRLLGPRGWTGTASRAPRPAATRCGPCSRAWCSATGHPRGRTWCRCCSARPPTHWGRCAGTPASSGAHCAGSPRSAGTRSPSGSPRTAPSTCASSSTAAPRRRPGWTRSGWSSWRGSRPQRAGLRGVAGRGAGARRGVRRERARRARPRPARRGGAGSGGPAGGPRAVAMDPLADAQAVLVRSLGAAGDHAGARRQAERCTDLFRRELGCAAGRGARRRRRAADRTAAPRSPPRRCTASSEAGHALTAAIDPVQRIAIAI